MSVGVVPASKILDESAPGFHFEAFLCGDNAASLPLGGIEGLAALFHTIREIPAFSRVPTFNHGIEHEHNITISTVAFANDVSICTVFLHL